MLRGMINLNAKRFVVNVYVKILMVTIISVIPPVALYLHYNEGFVALILNSAVCVISSIFCVYIIGCSKEERAFINGKLKQIIRIIK